MNVYDFDGTIYNGDSTLDFFRYCIKKHKKIFLVFPNVVIGFAMYLFGIITKTMFKQRFFTFLRYIENIDDTVFKFWYNREAKFKQWYLAQKSNDDIIISASPEFLLLPVCQKLGVKLIASRVDKFSGIFTGENCYGIEKARRLEIEFPDIKISSFYSDNQSDYHLAQIASEAYLVKDDSVIPWNEYKTSVSDKIKNTFFTPEFFLFVFCGGCGTLVNFFFSLFFSNFNNSTLAYICGYFISMLVTYTLNTYLIFKLSFSFIRFIKFIISYIPNFLILVTFVAVLLNIFKLHEIFVYLAAAVFGLPVTYILVKIFAFGSKKEKK